MSYEDNQDGEALQEPPQYDTLTVKFKGDDYCITLPYCEVANGYIDKISDNKIKIILPRANGDIEERNMTFSEFSEAIEKTFDTKKVISLLVQKAEDYEIVKVL
jgi:hypothetical protein